MAVITDPIVVKWVNEELRPLSEQMLMLLEQATLFADNFEDSIAPILNAAGVVGTDDLDDGRAAEGISQLKVSDIRAFVAIAKNLRTMADTNTRRQVRKPTVRPLRVGV